MRWTNTERRYGAGPRLLHWVIALFVIVALVFIETRGYAPRGSALRGNLRAWHQQLGLAVFLLLWVRIAFRANSRRPAITPAPPAWQERLGGLLHFLFYVLLLALPLIGIVMVQADNRTVSLLGLELPRMVAADKDFSHQLERVHRWMGNAMIGLIGAHVTAALWHHVVQRDDTLRRML